MRIGSTTRNVTQNLAYFKMALLPGTYDVVVSCVGYDQQTVSITVRDEDITEQRVALQRSASINIAKLNIGALNPHDTNNALDNLQAHFSKASKLSQVGETEEKTTITCLEINEGDKDKPAIIFAAGVYQGAPLTSRLLVQFAKDLLYRRENDSVVAKYLDKFAVHIAPLLYPDQDAGQTCSSDESGFLSFDRRKDLSHDAKVIVDWFKKVNPVLVVNLNTGAKRVEIPYGEVLGRQEGYKTDDDQVLRNLAMSYVNNNAIMSSGQTACTNVDKTGVTHGGEAVLGGRKNSLMDLVYANTSALMMDVYVSCCNNDLLGSVWEENKHSLLAVMEQAYAGVSGYVINEDDEPVENAIVSYNGSRHRVRNGKNGAFWIILSAGSYTVTVKAPGYNSVSKLIDTPNLKLFSRLMIRLHRNDSILGVPWFEFVLFTGNCL